MTGWEKSDAAYAALRRANPAHGEVYDAESVTEHIRAESSPSDNSTPDSAAPGASNRSSSGGGSA